NLGFGEVWISGEFALSKEAVISAPHGLKNIDPFRCQFDVIFKCISDSNGYSPGDIGVGFCSASVANNVTRTLMNVPSLSDTSVQYNIGNNGIFGLQKNNGKLAIINTDAELACWALIFRIFR
ncbi:hypothetical protein, partial [Pectobacterium sp. B1J-3]|uniref:hypothetical protein n=1 Tax=Pectobacterium sp. B1J-3 TaxID=3385371 RepID=UPI003905CD48